MKWGECKLRCLQTMFANEGPTLTENDSNRDYLYAMPGKANEAMLQLSLVGRPLIKEAKIAVGVEDEDAAVSLEALGKGEIPHVLALKEVAPDFRAVEQLMLYSQGIYAEAEEYRTVGTDTLVLPGDIVGVYTLLYKAYPAQVSLETLDDEVLDVNEECAALVPIYMAAELYKDDDLSLATVLRNEYEDGLQKVRAAWEQSGGNGYSAAKRRNTTGWW